MDDTHDSAGASCCRHHLLDVVDDETEHGLTGLGAYLVRAVEQDEGRRTWVLR